MCVTNLYVVCATSPYVCLGVPIPLLAHVRIMQDEQHINQHPHEGCDQDYPARIRSELSAEHSAAADHSLSVVPSCLCPTSLGILHAHARTHPL